MPIPQNTTTTPTTAPTNTMSQSKPVETAIPGRSEQKPGSTSSDSTKSKSPEKSASPPIGIERSDNKTQYGKDAQPASLPEPVTSRD